MVRNTKAGGGPERGMISRVFVRVKWEVTGQLCLSICIDSVPTAQGKQGKWPKEFPVRENTGNLTIFAKHREFGLLKLKIP